MQQLSASVFMNAKNNQAISYLPTVNGLDRSTDNFCLRIDASIADSLASSSFSRSSSPAVAAFNDAASMLTLLLL